MVAASLLPVAIHNGDLYFLMGKENELESSAKGFSDFGGRVEAGESLYAAALREGSEELTGFLGNPAELKSLIRRNGGTFPLAVDRIKYNVFAFRLDYSADLPVFYNRNHAFLWKHMGPDILGPTKLFEKIEIQWFSLADLKKKRALFRPFYREVVDLLIDQAPALLAFASRPRSQTKKSK